MEQSSHPTIWTHGENIMCLLVQKEYKPGDLPPKGNDYLAWHEWAEVQRKAKIKQVPCGRCGKWLTPQEVDSHMAQHFTNGIALDALLS
jgi:hypothetical protein